MFANETQRQAHQMLPVYREHGVYNFYLKKGQHGSVAPLEAGYSSKTKKELVKIVGDKTKEESEEKFDHCKHEACEEPEDTEVARELELFVQVYSCREFVYSPCTKIVAASSLLASGGREGGREEE